MGIGGRMRAKPLRGRRLSRPSTPLYLDCVVASRLRDPHPSSRLSRDSREAGKVVSGIEDVPGPPQQCRDDRLDDLDPSD